jgi:hypothetical protein
MLPTIEGALIATDGLTSFGASYGPAHVCWTLENKRYWADHDEFMRELVGDFDRK